MPTTKPSPNARDVALDNLHPAFRARLVRGLARANAAGLPVHLFEGLRSFTRQEALYAQGRTMPGPIITRARGDLSWHQYGLAADLAFDKDAKTPKVEWTWNGNWALLGAIMMHEGLVWYGSPGSPFREAPHFQLATPGLTITRAKALKAQGGLPMVWAEVTKLLKETP